MAKWWRRAFDLGYDAGIHWIKQIVTAMTTQRLRVLLVQLPVPNNPSTNVPLAAGYLKAYAHAQGLLDQIEIEMLPRDVADTAGDAAITDAIVAHRPDVLGCSLYTWNSERTLGIAAAVKALLPDVRVVVGGPEVQRDNVWVLRHPAVDIAVIGEGEVTFVEVLRSLLPAPAMIPLHAAHTPPIAGTVVRGSDGSLHFGADRAGMADLGVVPSPYLLGFLELRPDDMLMVEVSRWCPYACSFCLYGRNMGAKLGNRYFNLERVLAEIRWGRDRGLRRVHFIEANLNLVPIFRPLMQALADLNADGQLELYAELRGEHLTDVAVDALVQAGLKVAEVGLQTANPVALQAAHRRTDLRKWAAGTRRLYARGVDVLLDVILGLPADTADGVQQTLDFIGAEELGEYDIFTLQVLPATAVRQQADAHGLRFQMRPPYYVLGTSELDYPALQRLRRTLKREAGLEPDAVEGCPEPDLAALGAPTGPLPPVRAVAAHQTVVARWSERAALGEWLAGAIIANPSTLFDVYFVGEPPVPAEVRTWRDGLPYQPGYLDRVAVYRSDTTEPDHVRVSPRVWLVVPWEAQIDPHDYAPAEIIWHYRLEPGEEPPLRAWRSAGGAGIAVHATPADLAHWRAAGVRLWQLDQALSPSSLSPVTYRNAAQMPRE